MNILSTRERSLVLSDIEINFIIYSLIFCFNILSVSVFLIIIVIIITNRETSQSGYYLCGIPEHKNGLISDQNFLALNVQCPCKQKYRILSNEYLSIPERSVSSVNLISVSNIKLGNSIWVSWDRITFKNQSMYHKMT